MQAIAKNGRDPGYGSDKPIPLSAAEEVKPDEIKDAEAESNLARLAVDGIERRISTDFAGHDFALLIAEILKAQGYTVNVSPPGADKGIDIVAGIGTLGFDQPRLVVQVKSGNIVADQQTLQALIGAVQDVQGSQGLLVCWGGFTKPVEQRRNELFFRIRLWGRQQVLDALFEVYDKLPEWLRAELPLRRVWMLEPEVEE